MMFISQDEVAELTGYQQPKRQAKWLADNGYRFALDATGRPKVLREEVENYLIGKVKGRSRSPNFAALHGVR